MKYLSNKDLQTACGGLIICVNQKKQFQRTKDPNPSMPWNGHNFQYQNNPYIEK